MAEDVPTGQRFSLIYLRPDKPVADSGRLRLRLQKRFQEAAAGQREPIKVGYYLEGELGIKVVDYGPGGSFIQWDKVGKWELRDVLCTITLVGRYVARTRPLDARHFREEVGRILSEEYASYRIDDDFGIHPAIDSAFQANLAEAIRGTNEAAYVAARDFLSKADQVREGPTHGTIIGVPNVVKPIIHARRETALSICF